MWCRVLRLGRCAVLLVLVARPVRRSGHSAAASAALMCAFCCALHAVDGCRSRPFFRIVCLYVEEEESIRRQLHRGELVRKHNDIVKASGLGTLLPVRDTDTSEEKARLRYQLFKTQVYAALKVRLFSWACCGGYRGR